MWQQGDARESMRAGGKQGQCICGLESVRLVRRVKTLVLNIGSASPMYVTLEK